MKTVLVIGAAGFVGPYLIKNLRDHNFKVIPTKLKNQKVKDKSFIDLDILNINNISKVLSKYKPDYIVHLAAQANVGLSWKEPILTFNINVIGSLNLLESIRQLKIYSRVLLVGTSEQYGQIDKMPIKENVKTNPTNFYALSKMTQEQIGKIYSSAYGLDIVFARSFNHIGPGQSLGFVVPDLCSQVVKLEKSKEESNLYVGNLSSKRDFTDVRDIVDAYRLLLLKGKSNEIYNVGSGKAIPISDLLKEILKLSKKRIKVVVDKNKYRPIDTPIIAADISKLKKDTGYYPKYKISETIKKTLKYYRDL